MVCRFCWVDVQSTQYVECYYGLHCKLVPNLNWPLAIGGAEPTDEVVLESLDGAFRGIYAMVGWINQLPLASNFLEVPLKSKNHI